ncbi:unnamed protein product [Cunninghamella blakesleeana]
MDFEPFGSFQLMTTSPRQFPDIDLKDINGKAINIKQLANDYQLILITLKSTICMVCPQLLVVLNFCGLNANCTTYHDIFSQEEYVITEIQKKLFRLLLHKDAYYLVLCPGTNDQIAQIQIKSDFQYPFIAGDQAMELGKALKLNMSEDELWPTIMKVTKDSLDVYPVYIGRSPGQYHHRELLELLIRERNNCERDGFKAISNAYQRINQLKRRIVKCETNTLIPKTFSFTKALNSTTTTTTSSSPSSLSISSTNNHNKNHCCLLPPELLDLVLSNITDIKSLVRLSRTSRNYYISVCNTLILKLRSSIHHVQNALPEGCDDAFNVLPDSALNRWKENNDGVGYRELELRVNHLSNLLDDIGLWTTLWSTRKKIVLDNTFLSGPIPS